MLEMNGGHAGDSDRDGDPASPAVQEPEFAFPGRWASQPAVVDGQANGQGRPRGLRRWPRATLAALVAVGLAATAGGGTALALEMTRHATRAEALAAATAEVSSRWQRLTAGQIFPRQPGYLTSAGTRLRATLAGIAPRATCTQATDPVMARALVRAGCVTVLRATYADGSGALVATAGIAVMPSAAAAERAFAATEADSSAGVRAVSFAGTVANLFGDAQRQVFTVQNAGPYIFFVSAGYADGRPASQGLGELQFSDLSSGMIDDLTAIMTSYRNPCGEKDIRC